MAVLYTYTKYQDLYSLKNVNTNSITYTFSRKECDSLTLVQSKVIPAGETIYLPLSYKDGKYQVDITDGTNTVHIYDILYYQNLLLSVIDNIEESVCPCVCKECDECGDSDSCKVDFNTIVSAMSFSIVNTPKYTKYFELIAKELQCTYDELVLASLSNKMINGEENVKDLYLKTISLYYLAFYYVDLVGAKDADEVIYIKTKYKSEKILKCIKKLGIDVIKISNLLLSSMNVYYWQLDNTIGEINSVASSMSVVNYLDDKPYLPFSTFEQGVNINYTKIGRIAFAIKETDIQNFLLNDSLGNDVTNDYDVRYLAGTKTALFVSKSVISITTLFFKFKKITNV